MNLTRTSANVTGVALATIMVTITMGSLGYEPSLSAITDGGDEGARVAFIEGMARAFMVSTGLMAGATALSLLRGETTAKSPNLQTDQQTAASTSGDD